MKVNILGTEYEIIKDVEEKDYPKVKGLSGYTDFSIKKIIIRKFVEDNSSLEDLKYYQREVLRHEIIHAFLYESGLDSDSDFARNEELIDWIAIQFEKMLEAFTKVGAIVPTFPDINYKIKAPNVKIMDELDKAIKNIDIKI